MSLSSVTGRTLESVPYGARDAHKTSFIFTVTIESGRLTIYGGRVEYREAHYLESEEVAAMLRRIQKIEREMRKIRERFGCANNLQAATRYAAAANLTTVMRRRHHESSPLADQLFGGVDERRLSDASDLFSTLRGIVFAIARLHQIADDDARSVILPVA